MAKAGSGGDGTSRQGKGIAQPREIAVVTDDYLAVKINGTCDDYSPPSAGAGDLSVGDAERAGVPGAQASVAALSSRFS